MARLAFGLLFLVFATSLTGCVRPEAAVVDEMVWSERALREHLRQLATPVAPGEEGRRTHYAAGRMRAAGLMPARDPSFLVSMGSAVPLATRFPASGLTRAHVLGYVTGRHPGHFDELVIVAADLDGPGAAAALEAARVLAERARDIQEPERTVLFALWAPPHTGDAGVRDYLANPTWALEYVHRVLLVTTDTAAVADSRQWLEAQGLATEVVTVFDQSVAGQDARPEVEQARALVRTVLLTDALYARIHAAALYTPPE